MFYLAALIQMPHWPRSSPDSSPSEQGLLSVTEHIGGGPWAVARSQSLRLRVFHQTTKTRGQGQSLRQARRTPGVQVRGLPLGGRQGCPGLSSASPKLQGLEPIPAAVPHLLQGLDQPGSDTSSLNARHPNPQLIPPPGRCGPLSKAFPP